MSAEVKEVRVDGFEAEDHQSINHQDREVSGLSHTRFHVYIFSQLLCTKNLTNLKC